nr:uncharacterized protein LOC121469627 isoform X2 [Taeniopygia guttata]
MGMGTPPWHRAGHGDTGLGMGTPPWHRAGHRDTALAPGWVWGHCPGTGMGMGTPPWHRAGHGDTGLGMGTPPWHRAGYGDTGLGTGTLPWYRAGHGDTALAPGWVWGHRPGTGLGTGTPIWARGHRPGTGLGMGTPVWAQGHRPGTGLGTGTLPWHRAGHRDTGLGMRTPPWYRAGTGSIYHGDVGQGGDTRGSGGIAVPWTWHTEVTSVTSWLGQNSGGLWRSDVGWWWVRGGGPGLWGRALPQQLWERSVFCKGGENPSWWCHQQLCCPWAGGAGDIPVLQEILVLREPALALLAQQTGGTAQRVGNVLWQRGEFLHRVDEAGRDPGAHPVPGFLRDVSRWVWNLPREGDSSTALGRLLPSGQG